jgi:transposase-like protein
LKEPENDVPISEHCGAHGMSSATFYQWRVRQHKGIKSTTEFLALI